MNSAANQLAVIMARGESLRMGKPKGLCRLPDQDESFLSSVVGLYKHFEMPTLLVVRPEDEAVYKEIISQEKVDTLTAAGGGDTAQTMKFALDWAHAKGLNPEIFWAHPVDMPLVQPQTITSLMEAAGQGRIAAWRPVCQNNPGHPVLIPAALLSVVLDASSLGVSMAQAWKAATAQGKVSPIKLLKVDDSGVITDFDTPGQLHSAQEKKAPES